MKDDNRKLLGILGGLGPMSTAYFYEMITEHTEASCDQDHIDMVISSSATTPDRTGYILGNSADNPAERMIADAKKLEAFGADVITIPCNTAHYFYSEVQENVSVPIIHIIYETVKYCKSLGAEKIGIMATDGTILSNTYQRIAAEFGMDCVVPCQANQQKVMDIIYKSVKQGKHVDMNKFADVTRELTKAGSDRIILGCTELSLIKRDHGLDNFYVDALEVLAWRSIQFCGKKPIGFEEFNDEI